MARLLSDRTGIPHERQLFITFDQHKLGKRLRNIYEGRIGNLLNERFPERVGNDAARLTRPGRLQSDHTHPTPSQTFLLDKTSRRRSLETDAIVAYPGRHAPGVAFLRAGDPTTRPCQHGRVAIEREYHHPLDIIIGEVTLEVL